MKIRTGMNVKVLSLGRLIFFVDPSIRTAMLCFSINPTIFNIICWVAGFIASTTKSKYYFDKLKIKQWVAGLDLEHLTLKNM